MDAWSRGLAGYCCLFLEGIMKKHMVVGKMSRDTVYFAILNNEWPAALQSLSRKLRIPAEDDKEAKEKKGADGKKADGKVGKEDKKKK
jgi:hypothetical protein